jgi:hypothetical protein
MKNSSKTKYITISLCAFGNIPALMRDVVVQIASSVVEVIDIFSCKSPAQIAKRPNDRVPSGFG